MKLKIVLILIAFLGFTGCATKPEQTSINKIIESPDNFNGKAITIEGFAYLDIETRLICSAPEELNQCLWLQIPKSYKEIESTYKIETGSKIIASGVFRVKNVKSERNSIKNGVMYIRFGPYWHVLQKVKLKKAKG
jgi:hypothetical protein